MSTGVLIFIAFILLFLLSGVKILNEYERGVVFRLGRIIAPKGPGLRWIIPGVDKMIKISLRLITMDVPPQDVITRDNVSVKVNAVVYFRVADPVKAVIQVENYLYATSQLAQTTLRSILGQVELDDLLSEREKLNVQIQEVLDRHTDPWGIKVSLVEIKYVDLPQEMQRAMARQAEAERDRPFFYLAAAYGPHGIKHAVKQDPSEEPDERKVPDGDRIGFSVNRDPLGDSVRKLKPHIHEREE